MTDAPERIWANGLGVYGETDHGGTEYTRADLAPTDAQVMQNEKVKALVEALRDMLGAICGDTGFAACVRADAQKVYPWPALDAAEERGRAALRALETPQ